MLLPATADTIIAISSGWDAAQVGIVRISGPRAFELARHFYNEPANFQGRRGFVERRLTLELGLTLPATVYWFRGPHSYTGQNLIELHTSGSLPALRLLTQVLIERGARRALPGEFTSRAYLNGRLDAQQVDGVFALIHAEDQSAARSAARIERDSVRSVLREAAELIEDLLARVEAGIDFVEEEGIQFITPAEIAAQVDKLRRELEALREAALHTSSAHRPHVALAGLPNAGKSTLFNALLGEERALVAPVLGTTRDVLSAELHDQGNVIILQDCAGLGHTLDELALAAHLAAEQTAETADLVLWVHASENPWTLAELDVCDRIPESRRLLVLSKSDLSTHPEATPQAMRFVDVVSVSVACERGVSDLRKRISTRLRSRPAEDSQAASTNQVVPVLSGLERVRKLAQSTDPAPELIAMELRNALDGLRNHDNLPVPEIILGRIFAQFCIGK